MIVVSDTSVISNLFLVGHFELLPKLFQSVILPKKVFEELAELQQFGIDISPITNAKFIDIQMPTDQNFIQSLLKILDEEEAQAIALAIELKADLLLIDELKGRAIAAQHGLNITGLLGILIRAKQNNLLAKVKPVMDDLRSKANFFISDKLYDQILQLASE